MRNNQILHMKQNLPLHLFGRLVKYTDIQFSIYSAIWIRPTVQVWLICYEALWNRSFMKSDKGVTLIEPCLLQTSSFYQIDYI